ncbi:thioredoxin domain-containing protein, partial [Myxococcota bacterium]|nr:thioredoxin domain-containing protein [Myxococcota bacterium]
MGVPKMISALDLYLDEALQIVIIAPEDGHANELLNSLRKTLVPNRVIAFAHEGPELEALAKEFPLAASKIAIGKKATAYVCRAGVCELPTSDPNIFKKQLSLLP